MLTKRSYNLHTGPEDTFSQVLWGKNILHKMICFIQIAYSPSIGKRRPFPTEVSSQLANSLPSQHLAHAGKGKKCWKPPRMVSSLLRASLES